MVKVQQNSMWLGERSYELKQLEAEFGRLKNTCSRATTPPSEAAIAAVTASLAHAGFAAPPPRSKHGAVQKQQGAAAQRGSALLRARAEDSQAAAARAQAQQRAAELCIDGGVSSEAVVLQPVTQRVRNAKAGAEELVQEQLLIGASQSAFELRRPGAAAKKGARGGLGVGHMACQQRTVR